MDILKEIKLGKRTFAISAEEGYISLYTYIENDDDWTKFFAVTYSSDPSKFNPSTKYVWRFGVEI